MKHPVDTSQWGEFNLDDLFEFVGSKQVKSQHNLIETDKENGIPFVVQSNQNNMVKCYVTKESLTSNDENIYDGNVLVLGVVTPVASYQAEDFGASQSIILKSDKLNPLRGQFLVSVIRSVIESKYNYSNIPGIQKYKQDVIPLPLKPTADPENYTQENIDWDYMEAVMSRVTARAKDRLASLPQPTDKKKTPVDTSAWGEFLLKDIAILTNGNKFDKNKMSHDNPSINFVSRTGFNNGISDFVDKIDGVEPYPAGAITLALGGSVGSTFVQPKPFYTGQNVGVIEFENKSDKMKQFVAVVLNKVCSTQFSAFKNEINKHFKRDLTIPLPLKPSADPENYTQDDIDWDYMENFMQAIEEKAHARVASLKKQI